MLKHQLLLVVGLAMGLSTSAFSQDKAGKLADLIKTVETGTDAAKITAIVALAELGPDAERVPALLVALQGKGEDLRLNAALALGKVGKAAVEPLTSVLAKGNPSDRYYAIFAIGMIGAPAKSAAPRVVEALADKDESVRRKAAYALGRINPDPDAVIPALVKLLADSSADVRQSAAESLGKFGSAAVAPLISALKDDSVALRTEAARALGNIGAGAKDAIPELKALLLADAKLSNDAAEALAKIGKASIPALTEAMRSDKAEIRSRALKMLGKIGADAVPVLVDALGDKLVDVRQHAAQELAPLRVSDKLVVLALAHAVHDSDQTVRRNALQALQVLGTGAKLAAPKLVAALKDSDGGNRAQILGILQNLGESEHIVPVAAELLKDKDVQVRRSAVGLLGSQGKAALPHLIQALNDDDLTVRYAAVDAVQRIPGDIKDALPALLALLKEGQPFQKRNVVMAMGRVGEPAVPGLIECLKDTNNFVRSSAVLALTNMGADGKKAVPTLIDLAITENAVATRRNAVLAVAKIDPEKLSDLFVRVRKTDDEKVRLGAYQAIGASSGKKVVFSPLPAKVCLPHLIEGTKDKSANIRLIVVQSMARFGTDAKDAVPAVTALLEDPDLRVRNQAQVTLNQIKAK